MTILLIMIMMYNDEAAFDDKKIDVDFYPPSLKDKIGRSDGSFVFDIYEILGE